MTTDEEIFNSDTKDSPEEEIFNSDTKETPHRFHFSFCLDLPSQVVQKFPPVGQVNRSRNRIWLARHPRADIILFDTEMPRPGLEIQCVRNGTGEILTLVKNFSDKRLELTIPGRDKISLDKDEQSKIETNTVLTVSLLTMIISIQTGDTDSSRYEFTMDGLNTEDFNQLMLSITGNLRRSSNNQIPPLLRTSGNGNQSAQLMSMSRNINNPQLLQNIPNPHGITTSFMPVLPSSDVNILPSSPLSTSWPTSSFRSQTQVKQVYSPYPQTSQTFGGPNNLNQSQPAGHYPFEANIQPQPSSHGFNQVITTTCPGSIYQTPSLTQFQDLHPYERSNSATGYPRGICIHCTQQNQPNNPGGQCQQCNGRARCYSDTQRMESLSSNWHNSLPRGDLPVAPPVGSNYVNTHPYTENTPHSFNVYNLGEYTEKQM